MSAIATETNERKMWPCIAGTISSQKLSEIQSHSMSFGSSMDERSCSNARAGLATRVVPGAGELLDGVYSEQTLFAVSLNHALGAAGADDLRERVPHVQVAVYAGQILGFAVGRLEPYVADSDEGEPLEDAVGADERGDELGVWVSEDCLGGVVLGEDAALLENGDLVPHLYGLVYVVGDEDDGLLYIFLNPQELVLEPLARYRVDSAEGLVHQHDGGVSRQRPSDPYALLLAARELGRVAVAVLFRREADELEELVHSIPDAVLVPAEQVGDGTDVVGDGAVGEEAYLLDGVADLAPQPGGAHGRVRLAVDEDLALGDLDQAVDHSHGRGLAAAAGSHQNTDLSFEHLEGEIRDHRALGAGVGLAYLPKLDHCTSCGPRCSTRSFCTHLSLPFRSWRFSQVSLKALEEVYVIVVTPVH